MYHGLWAVDQQGKGNKNRGVGMFGFGSWANAKRSAEVGQKGEPFIWGRGTCKFLCLNWMVLDHLTPITAPDELRWTSDLHKCFSGSNLSGADMSKFDLRKNEKNPTRHAAQKEMSKGWLKSRTDRIPRNRSVVIRSFWLSTITFVAL